jgi:hypothetical protein
MPCNSLQNLYGWYELTTMKQAGYKALHSFMPHTAQALHQATVNHAKLFKVSGKSCSSLLLRISTPK